MEKSVFENLLKDKFPDLYKQIHSPQFSLSKNLLELRTVNNFSIGLLSKLLNISEEDYLKFEYGEICFKVEQYEKIIERVNSIISEEKLKNNLSVFDEINKIDFNVPQSNKSYLASTFETKAENFIRVYTPLQRKTNSINSIYIEKVRYSDIHENNMSFYQAEGIKKIRIQQTLPSHYKSIGGLKNNELEFANA